MGEYILYKGEEVLAAGSIKNIANQLGVGEATVRYYGTPSYKRRTTGHNGRRLVAPKTEPTIYALYKGEYMLGVGTIDELSNELDIKKDTLYHYGTPAYRRRTSEDNGRRLIKLEE